MKKLWLIAMLFGFTKATKAQDEAAVYPVSVSNVQAGVQHNETVLQWSTVCYVSFAKFEVQRSFDGLQYTTLHAFSADKLRCRQPFTFNDTLTTNDGLIYYRINAGDRDGAFYQSKIVRVINKGATQVFKAFPTLVHSSVGLSLYASSSQPVTISLINVSGIVTKQYKYSVAKGSNNLNLDLGGIANGMYYVTYADAAGTRQTTRIIKN